MKNKLSDLNNHLFASLERLNDEELTGDALIAEIGRSKAINEVAEQVIANASLVLKAQIAIGDSLRADLKLPAMLEAESGES